MAEEYVTEEMILGQDFGDNNFDSVSPATLKNANFFIWGWTVYSDVFRHTDPHVTEFCRKLNNVVSVPVPNSPGNLTMVWDLCPQHNCTDQECPDYDTIVKASEATQKPN